MNIYGIETFLIGTIASSVILVLFVYLRNRALNSSTVSHSPQFRQSAPTVEGRAVKSTKQRRKIESNPSIICSLPIHQTARPNARLF